RGRHTIFSRDWSSDVCSSDLGALKLQDGVVAFRREDLIFGIAHVCATKFTPLQYSQPVTVQRRVDARRLFVVRLTDHQTNLSVWICALSDELKIGGYDEVATHLVIHVMKLVPFKPDVVS